VVATAPLTSDWPCPSPLVDVPNWVDDVYLTGRSTDAFIGSRFANQSHMLCASSSFCCCVPDALRFNNIQSPTSPTSHPHPSRTKSLTYSIDSTSSIQQTAPGLPNRGRRAFSWCTFPSHLHPPYEVQLLLFLRGTLTYPSYYFTPTALITVRLKTLTESLLTQMKGTPMRVQGVRCPPRHCQPR
jgi:hypothetical protein